MNREFILRELTGRLWHTTHPDRFRGIITSRAIIPEPDIPNSKRWKTSKGPKYHPYVRTLCGVSLFDFKGFDPECYSKQFPFCSWDEFVPFRNAWGCAVWIEIDRARMADNFISATDLVARWDLEKAYNHTIMPHIEAAYVGDLSISTFIRAFAVRQGEKTLERLELE